MFHAERRAAALHAFGRLSPVRRAALTLRYRDNLPPSKVGRTLGISAEEAQALIAAAMQELEAR